jgi:hypothetical protein
MRMLEHQVLGLAHHAKTLRQMPNFDGRLLLEEANSLLRNLMASRLDFEQLEGRARSLKRQLPNRPPRSPRPFQYEFHGPPPAAQWGSEFQAASRRFIQAIVKAENQIRQLMDVAFQDLHKPTRTSTEASSLVDVVMNFIEFLNVLLAHQKNRKG